MAEVPGTLTEALILLQSKLPRITKDAEGQMPTKTGMRTYPYASLAAIHDAVFPLLAECGLAWTCCPTIWTEKFVLTYELTHISGSNVKGWYPLPSSGTPQQIGSAITYARRYCLTAVLGIAPIEDDDDDGQAAERAAADDGRMSREQKREHGQLERDVKSSPRKAERVHGPAPDNAVWETRPEDQPGSINRGQVDAMRILMGKLRIESHDDRMQAIRTMLNLAEPPGSSNDLSHSQGAEMIRKLQKLTSEEGRPAS